MSDKRKLHHLYTRVRKINPKVLLFVMLLSGFIAIIALRSNNIEMVQLRENVFIADERGEGVDEALNELRQHVYAHMNTDLSSGGISIKPPIQLKHTYERLVAREKERVKAHNSTITTRATNECEARFPAGQIRQRAACVDDYIASNAIEEKSIPKELYQFDFASPSWSPDLAGYAILATVLFGLLLVVRLAVGAFFEYELK